METKELLEYEIYPKLDLLELLGELEIRQKSGYYVLRCPQCGKKEAYIPNKPTLKPVIVCNRRNKCAYVSSIWNYLKDTRNLTNRDVLELLAANANISLEPYRYTHTAVQKQKECVTILYKRAYTPMPEQFKRIDYRENLNNFAHLDTYEQYKTILTFIYAYSLRTNQTDKNAYYKKRGIDKVPENIGFLSHEDIQILGDELLRFFPSNKLHDFGLFKNGRFKFGFSSFCIVPSVDLASSLVTALRFRSIYPVKIKEIEISNQRMLNPLPYGMSYKNLQRFDSFYLTEGHIDALSLGVENFVAIEGVNSFNHYHLKLFENKTLYLCFDQDKAGKDAAVRLSQQLQTLEIKHKIASWNSVLGKDINELLQNGNDPLKIIHKSF